MVNLDAQMAYATGVFSVLTVDQTQPLHDLLLNYLRNIRGRFQTSSHKIKVDDSVVAYVQAGTARECQMLGINVPVDLYLNKTQII